MAKFSLDVVRAIWKEMTNSNHFDRVMKTVSIVSAGDGRAVAEMCVREEDTNRGGTLHGGLTSTLVDTVSTLGLMTTRDNLPGVSVDLNVSFLKGVKVGETIVIESETVRAGSTLAFLHVQLRNKKTGEVVALGSHTKFLAAPKNKL
jgi:acyl-coenzyme A thioesterase 13